MTPYAEELGGHVRLLPELSEEGCRDDADSTRAVVSGLLDLGVPACLVHPPPGHGDRARCRGRPVRAPARQWPAPPEPSQPEDDARERHCCISSADGRVVAIDRFET